MARMPRFLIPHQQTTYHVISRTALDGYPLGEQEKSLLLATIKQLSSVYFCEVLGFCVMGNTSISWSPCGRRMRYRMSKLRKAFSADTGMSTP